MGCILRRSESGTASLCSQLSTSGGPAQHLVSSRGSQGSRQLPQHSATGMSRWSPRWHSQAAWDLSLLEDRPLCGCTHVAPSHPAAIHPTTLLAGPVMSTTGREYQ